MNRRGTNYLRYLEALTLSLLAERERNGKGEYDTIEGVDMFAKQVTYSPYLAKQAIKEAMEQPLDNSKDYSEDNVVPCCDMCNTAKSVYSIEEFLKWVGRVYSRHLMEN